MFSEEMSMRVLIIILLLFGLVLFGYYYGQQLWLGRSQPQLMKLGIVVLTLGNSLAVLSLTRYCPGRWLRRRLNRPPHNWYDYHSSECGTSYRGCAPDCPKDTWERERRWIG